MKRKNRNDGIWSDAKGWSKTGDAEKLKLKAESMDSAFAGHNVSKATLKPA
jgi:hypothetical protein